VSANGREPRISRLQLQTGGGVRFDRAAASRRATVSEQPASEPPDGDPEQPRDGLTRAQARALSRCAPLTPDEFKAHRRVADKGLLPLPAVLPEQIDDRGA